MSARRAAASGRVGATVVIPTLDEERAISACLDSVLGQTYADVEVLVVDGGSTDRTVGLVRAAAASDARVRLLENRSRVASAALNLASRTMTSPYLIRVDAHSTIDPDYVERIVRHLDSGRWGGVGGRKDAIGHGPIGRAIAAVMASRLGVGNSTYHHGTRLQSVEHIPFGAYPRQVIDAVGGWDEELVANEDFEFDHRVAHLGERLLFDPDVRIRWECRDSFRSLWRQYRRYGRGKAQVAVAHPDSVLARHVAAPALVAVLAWAVVGQRRRRWALVPVGTYVAVVVAGTVSTAPSLDPAARRAVPLALVTMHLAWGIGFWTGLPGALRRRRRR